MKCYKVEACYICPNNIAGYCYGLDIKREFSEDDETLIVEDKFPKWCPLKDVSKMRMTHCVHMVVRGFRFLEKMNQQRFSARAAVLQQP